MTMSYAEAKAIVCSPDGRTDEEIAASWAVFMGPTPAELANPKSKHYADAAEPLPSTGKVYRPYTGVSFWWDVPSKSWHLTRDGADGDPETFKYMKEAKVRAKAITQGG